MSIKFNHTIVAAKDTKQSANYFTELFGLPARQAVRPFSGGHDQHGVSLDYAQVGRRTRRSIRSTTRSWSPSPSSTRSTARSAIAASSIGPIREARGPGEINHNDGGRGVYFQDPSGHYLEILTRPYGSGG